LILSATESATCYLVITPATSLPRGTPCPRTTTAMMAPRRHMRRITSKAVSFSPSLALRGPGGGSPRILTGHRARPIRYPRDALPLFFGQRSRLHLSKRGIEARTVRICGAHRIQQFTHAREPFPLDEFIPPAQQRDAPPQDCNIYSPTLACSGVPPTSQPEHRSVYSRPGPGGGTPCDYLAPNGLVPHRTDDGLRGSYRVRQWKPGGFK
jgi:hypothetical protein